MKVKDLLVPERFIRDSSVVQRLARGESGVWFLSRQTIAWFDSNFPRNGEAMPTLYSPAEMPKIDECWDDPNFRDWFMGSDCDSAFPGTANPSETLLIGETEPEVPIALDYRTTPPSVIYLNDSTRPAYWVRAFDSIDDMLDSLELHLRGQQGSQRE